LRGLKRGGTHQKVLLQKRKKGGGFLQKKARQKKTGICLSGQKKNKEKVAENGPHTQKVWTRRRKMSDREPCRKKVMIPTRVSLRGGHAVKGFKADGEVENHDPEKKEKGGWSELVEKSRETKVGGGKKA